MAFLAALVVASASAAQDTPDLLNSDSATLPEVAATISPLPVKRLPCPTVSGFSPPVCILGSLVAFQRYPTCQFPLGDCGWTVDGLRIVGDVVYYVDGVQVWPQVQSIEAPAFESERTRNGITVRTLHYPGPEPAEE